jgi:nitroreductase
MIKDEALKLALGYVKRNCPALVFNEIKEALAQPAQEPVAWSTDIEFDDDTEIVPPEEKGRLGTAGMTIPLYTAPQQRPWVGLTDGELSELSASGLALWALWRAIEAKLKEKNT